MKNQLKKQHLVILILTFLSGFSDLIYELVWSRNLSLIFGSSVYAVSTILACFMVGLALGSWFIGKWTDKNTSIIKIFFYLQLAIGVFGLFSPLLFSGISNLNIFIFQSFEVAQSLKPFIRIGLSFIFLAIPTIIMGGTLPVLIKSYSGQLNRLGKDAAGIYAANTIGGAAGAFITGFFLIKTLGIQGSIYLAAFINLFLAFIVFSFQNKIKVEEVKQHKDTKNRPVYSRKIILIVLAAYSFSGFTSLSYQVYWTKILTLFFRDSIYDFAIVLSAFLSGIVIGSLACGKYVKKIRNPVFVFSVIQISIGLFSLFNLFLIHQLPYLTNHLQSMTTFYKMYGESFWTLATLIKFGYAFLVMLIPTVLFGAAFPLVTSICVQDPKSMGREIGMVNAVNTLGATLGSLLAGFLFITLFGIQISVIFTAWLNICIGLVLFAFTHFKNNKTKMVALTCSLILSLLLTSTIPAWDQFRMSTSFLEPKQEIEKALTMEYYYEDAFGITSVVEFTPWNQKYLVSNRIYTQNTSDLMGPEDHRRLGHIPLLLHENPKNVLVIGLGAGITLRGVNTHEIENVDVVEISEGVKNAAGYFYKENNNVLENPHNHFIIEDGRNFAATSKKKFDVIIADIYFPMSSGSSNMFSKEYFELLKARLNQGGMFAQWLPLHQLSIEEVKIIAKTFSTVFPNTSLWYGMTGESVPVAGLIGMDEKLSIDLDSLFQKYQNSQLQESLNESALGDPFFLLRNFIMEGNSIEQFTGNAPINTDNRPILEFMSPKLHGEHGILNQQLLDNLKEDVSPYIKK